jgi:radical SAM-linked protein
VVEIFSMAFLRGGIPALYSAGFNPLPRLEITAPLSLGVSSLAEVAALDTEVFYDASLFIERLNHCLPRGFRLTGAENFFIPGGQKKHSLSSLLWGFEYESPGEPRRKVPREKEKEFRLGLGGGRLLSLYRLTRLAVLAAYPGGTEDTDKGLSYFEVYRRLYPAL